MELSREAVKPLDVLQVLTAGNERAPAVLDDGHLAGPHTVVEAATGLREVVTPPLDGQERRHMLVVGVLVLHFLGPSWRVLPDDRHTHTHVRK